MEAKRTASSSCSSLNLAWRRRRSAGYQPAGPRATSPRAAARRQVAGGPAARLAALLYTSPMKSKLLFALIIFAAALAAADSRTLRWSRLAVTAHLDADGRLHVQERHS